MVDLYLAGPNAPSLKHPTSAEIATIDRFAEDPAELENFRDHVARGMARAVNDPGAVLSSVEAIFSAGNYALEKRLTESVPEFEPWCPASPQPRILARAVGNSPAIDQFFRLAFGLPPSTESLQNLTGEEQSFEEYLLGAIWEYVKLVRTIEIVPNIEEAIPIMWLATRFDNYIPGMDTSLNRWKARLNPHYPTHTFVWKSKKGNWKQYLASVFPNMAKDFAQIVRAGGKLGREHPYGKIIASSSYSKFYKCRKDSHAGEVEEIFNRSWSDENRSNFLISIDCDPNNFAYSEILVKNILSYIMKSSLEDDKRVPVFAVPAPPKPGRTKVDAVLSVRERLATIDEFAKQNPGQSVSQLILDVFPELRYLEQDEGIALPTVAPAKWPEERIAVKGVLETPPEFIKRNYAQWLGHGLTRADVRRLDTPLSTALDNWLRKNEMPADLDLPTVKEQNTRWLDKIRAEGAANLPQGRVDSETIRHARRIDALERKRRSTGNTPG